MLQYLIVCPFVFLAGLVDSIAGGGGLIAFPAYVFAGIPIHVILGTSKLGAFPGEMVAAWRFAKSGYVNWKLAIPTGIMGFFGAIVGANIAMMISEEIIKSMMFIVLPVVAFYMFRNKQAVDDDAVSGFSEKKTFWLSMAIALVIGAYNGFYGPGTGTFLILALSGLVKMNTKDSAGLTKIINLSADIGGVVAYGLGGNVWIPLGLASAVFCMAGSYIGSGLVVNNGQKIVRPVIIVVLVLLFAKLVTGF